MQPECELRASLGVYTMLRAGLILEGRNPVVAPSDESVRDSNLIVH
jgi:hypothetical protein